MKTKTLFLICIGCLSFSLNAQDSNSSKKDFLKMAKYLYTGSGKWVSPNPGYDADNSKTAKSFGLWFKLNLRKNLLHLTHVVHRNDTAHVTGESYWLWHPGEQRIKYYSIDIRGNFADGETYFTSDNKFITTEYSYSVDGKIKIRKDENTILSDTEHQTSSSYFSNSQWTNEGNYRFKKTKKNENYKVIKYY